MKEFPAPLLIAKQLSKSFMTHPLGVASPLQILDSIDLELYPKEGVAIMGSSGEGKSTLLQLLGLLEKPSSGTIQFPLWKNLSLEQIRSRHIGFIFQQFLLLEDLSVLDNVILPMRIAKAWLSKKAMESRAMQWIDRVGLTSRAHHPASRLSGGEKQRCAIARALANDPDILLADEPTGNLDHDNAQSVAKLLFEIASERLGSLLLVTHDARLAKHADRILRLEKGKLQKIDASESFLIP